MGPSSDSTVFPDLASQVEIPVEGTLSRVLYRDDLVRVVLFAFDRDQELTEHTAAVPAIVQVIAGRLLLGLGEDTVEAVPGSWVHMPAHMAHSVRALEPAVMLLTLLRGQSSA